MREFESEIIKFVEKDGILFTYFKTEVIDLKIAEELIAARIKFTDDQKCIAFIDATKVKIIEKQARDLFGSETGTKNLTAAAIFTNSKLSVFLANFLIKVNLSGYKIPLKLFSNDVQATEWLKKYVK